MSSGLAIEVENLTKRYPRITAVDQLSLHVQAGRITAFLGRNGAGKSTTIKMLLGMTRPTAGTGAVLGKLSRMAHKTGTPAARSVMWLRTRPSTAT